MGLKRVAKTKVPAFFSMASKGAMAVVTTALLVL